jgi:hypothetical protein
MSEEKITFNRDHKFDLQLSPALIYERRLADIFENQRLEKIELKTEDWLWERTGNVCIEFRNGGKPSGLSVTQADMWVHELVRDGRTLAYIMVPMARLKEICRQAIERGDWRKNAGDDGRSHVVLLRLRDLLGP